MASMRPSTRSTSFSHRLLAIALIAAALLLGGCSLPGASALDTQDRILFWHDWNGADALLLDELIANYRELHPDVDVITVPHTSATILQEFSERFTEGIEPDLILTDEKKAQALIAAGSAKELSGFGVGSIPFHKAALSTVSDDGRIYALPFALSTQLLFYNKSRIPQAPATLAELRQVTADPGIAMGLNTNFLDAYWGLRAFGGRSYDSSGQFMLDQGALTNWLAALMSIQGTAGFVLSHDQDQLRQQFLQDEISLYVADASELGELAAVLGDQLGIAPLPQGNNGDPAGPLLEASVLLISANAEEQETATALELARFLTNSQQQSLIAYSNTGRYSAVETVDFSPGMPDTVIQLAYQLSSAVPMTLAQRSAWDQVATRGQTLYRNVIEGVLDEQEAARQLVAFAGSLRPAAPATASSSICPPISASGALTLTLWHAWADAETAVLEKIAGEFHTLCPHVTILLTAVGNGTTLYERYRAASAEGVAPDLLLGSSRWLALLAESGLIRSLDNELLSGAMTSFIPAAVRAVQYDEQIYAVPESVRTVALIYNPQMVNTPPKTLQELLLQVDSEHALTMPLTFFYAYWGLEAFGGNFQTTGGTAEPLQFDSDAAAAWLKWLHTAARRPGFLFTVGRAGAEYAFIKGEAAYLVSGPWSLPRLQAEMPAEQIAVALLPSGPVNRGTPILEVEGLMVNATVHDDVAAAGLAFGRYLTSPQSGEALLTTRMHVPANVTISLADTPLIDVLSEQAQFATGVVQDRRWQPVFDFGDLLYQSTVLENADIQAALSAFEFAITGAEALP